MDVDAFVAVSDYYKEVMKKNMNIPDEKLYSVHIGVDLKDYVYVPASEKKRTIGFISRTCYDNGLDILIDAFIELNKRNKFDDVNLVITGGSTGDDAAYLKNIKRKLKKNRLIEKVDFHEVFEGEGRKEFFQKVSVISVPVRNGEAFGIYLLEAMASGIPVVQPKLGAFPEIINLAEGGFLYHPNSSLQLANALADILSDLDRIAKLSSTGRLGIEKYFDISKHADEMINIYTEFSNKKKKINDAIEA